MLSFSSKSVLTLSLAVWSTTLKQEKDKIWKFVAKSIVLMLPTDGITLKATCVAYNVDIFTTDEVTKKSNISCVWHLVDNTRRELQVKRKTLNSTAAFNQMRKQNIRNINSGEGTFLLVQAKYQKVLIFWKTNQTICYRRGNIERSMFRMMLPVCRHH